MLSAQMPPFAGLLTFEAVLRLGSMTLAADELGLTQSAVSHRVRALERFFGVPLLERLNPGLRATEPGLLLARELAPLLGALAGLRRRVADPPGPRAFRLGLSTSLLAWWLSPRLPDLCNEFPNLAIEVCTWDTPAEAARTEVDLALLWLPHGKSEETCERHFPSESVFPVAAPKLLGANPLSTDWRKLPLLAKGRRGEETGREWAWSTWLGAELPIPREAMRFHNIGSSLQAAQDSNGVALARSLLAADALRWQRLVRLVSPDAGRPCSKIQVARWRDPGDHAAARMAAWLVAAARQDTECGSAPAGSGAFAIRERF